MLIDLLPYGFAALAVLVLVILVRYAVTLTRRAARQREELVRDAAGWGYHPAPEVHEEVGSALAESLRFQQGAVAVEELLRRVDRPPRYVVEYRFAGGSGSSGSRGVLFLLDRRAGPLPPFLLQIFPDGLPLGRLLLAGIERLVRLRWPQMRPVDLSSSAPQLGPAILYSPEPDAAAALLDARLLDALERRRGWSLESTGAWLLAEKHRRGGSGVPDSPTTLAALAEFEELVGALR